MLTKADFCVYSVVDGSGRARCPNNCYYMGYSYCEDAVKRFSKSFQSYRKHNRRKSNNGRRYQTFFLSNYLQEVLFMEWLTLLYEILEVCVIPLLGILTAYLIKYVDMKSSEIQVKVENDTADKYIAMLADTITDCVIATNQTYVEALKKENAFTVEAQKKAFNLTFNAVMAVLTDDAKDYLTEIYGDLTAYITTKIEAEVNISKNVPAE